MAIRRAKAAASVGEFEARAMTGTGGHKEPPRGASVKDVIRSLETNHPELAALAPISSAAVEAGDLIREARLDAGLPQSRLADAAGLSQPALSALERGEGKDGPTFRTLRDLAGALGLRIAFVPDEAGVAAEAPRLRAKGGHAGSRR